MTLAATPRAMNHFKIYAGTLQQQVETEWLRFLLGFGTSVSSIDGATTTHSERATAICITQSGNTFQAVEDRSVESARVESPLLATRIRRREPTLAKARFERRVESMHPGRVDLRLARRVGETSFSTHLPTSDPVASYLGDRATAGYFKRLMRSVRLWDGRAVRVLEKELPGVDRAKPHNFVATPAATEDKIVPSLEAEPGVENTNANDDSVSSEGGMR
jgi:hypothetical protein